MVRVLVLSVFGLCFSCSNDQHCEPGTPQKLLAIELSNNGIISYHHEILIEGLSKSCDSATVMSAVKNHIESSSSDMPISSVAVYNSAEHFDRGETLSQPKEFYGDCVVNVLFDGTSGKPKAFEFFDKDGDMDYEGASWKR